MEKWNSRIGWKAWPVLYGSLLAISAAWTVVVIHANPCVSGH